MDGNERKRLESQTGPRKHAPVFEGQTAGETAPAHTGTRTSSHSRSPLPLEPHGFDGNGPLARGGLQGGWTDVFPLRFFSITLVSSLLH